MSTTQRTALFIPLLDACTALMNVRKRGTNLLCYKHFNSSLNHRMQRSREPQREQWLFEGCTRAWEPIRLWWWIMLLKRLVPTTLGLKTSRKAAISNARKSKRRNSGHSCRKEKNNECPLLPQHRQR